MLHFFELQFCKFLFRQFNLNFNAWTESEPKSFQMFSVPQMKHTKCQMIQIPRFCLNSQAVKWYFSQDLSFWVWENCINSNPRLHFTVFLSVRYKELVNCGVCMMCTGVYVNLSVCLSEVTKPRSSVVGVWEQSLRCELFVYLTY